MRLTRTEITSLSVAALALAGSLGSAVYSYANRNRELDIKLVEIGLGILRADPKETNITPAREWAIQVVETNSGIKFTDADHKALLQQPIRYQPPTLQRFTHRHSGV